MGEGLRRDLSYCGRLSLVVAFLLCLTSSSALAAALDTARVQVRFPGRADALWTYAAKGAGASVSIAPPSFHLGGKTVRAVVPKLQEITPSRRFPNGTIERRFVGVIAADRSLRLEIVFRVSDQSPVVRFMYRLLASEPHTVSRISDETPLAYFGVSLAAYPKVTEVRLSEFVDLFHSYTPHEEGVDDRHFRAGQRVMGPLVVASNGARSLLLGYEHGSTSPNAFLQYVLGPDRRVELRGTKANFGRHVVDADAPFETLWFDIGAVAGNEDVMAAAFRQFVHRDLAPQGEARQPYVFYNTWNAQERGHQAGKGTYMTTMNTARILQDIDVAHAMGIEIFVIDTGWFIRTGDWDLDLKRFPDGLAEVRKRLSTHGMKLGLWFDPVMAATAGKAYAAHVANVASVGGKVTKAKVWESEESTAMCLVSSWADAFADRLIALSRELGVAYFKLDGLRTNACDLPGHNHGDDTWTADERLQRYAFMLPGAITRIAQKVTAANPEAIVDLDMTEDGRVMGLQFLTAGKYFLINNGPYTSDFDMPKGPYHSNVFFYPGPARGWIARAPLGYDRWIPSVLFLTHFFPDDPGPAQMSSVGSLILGGNGIWGDLQTVSAEGVRRIGDVLSHYKTVRNDMTATALHRSGTLSGSPEVYEKIASSSGKGAVVMFTTSEGTYEYITRTKPQRSSWTNDPRVSVQFDPQGHAHVKANLKKNNTAIVFFGTR